MGVLGDDDIRRGLHNDHDYAPPGDVCAGHFIEEKE